MNIKYRIDTLELRTTEHIDKSFYLEIVKWSNSSNKEYCYTIASFKYDKDGFPELHYCGNRPLELDKSELPAFYKLIKEGYIYKRNEDGLITEISL